MCGRFVTASSPQLLAERFGVSEVEIEEREPDYNVTPRAWVPAVRERRRDDPPTRVLTLLRWGLVPSWAKSLAIGDKQINARAESVAERPAYQAGVPKASLHHPRRRVLRVEGHRRAADRASPSSGAPRGAAPRR